MASTVCRKLLTARPILLEFAAVPALAPVTTVRTGFLPQGIKNGASTPLHADAEFGIWFSSFVPPEQPLLLGIEAARALSRMQTADGKGRP
ncbi:hypothetical protein BDZ88DRAFT_414093 [Geranomyces variabilis]|nr:hypothetical protein BDZ88DRAFT_414093 [Geranomyces variabilis]